MGICDRHQHQHSVRFKSETMRKITTHVIVAVAVVSLFTGTAHGLQSHNQSDPTEKKVLSKTKMQLTYLDTEYILDCELKQAIHASYLIEPSKVTSSVRGPERFIDTDIPKVCRKKSSENVPLIDNVSTTYDYLPLVNPWSLRHQKDIEATRSVALMLPMAVRLENKWKEVDSLVLCDKRHKVRVYAGLLYDGSDKNDFFLETHGMRTPDMLYKILLRQDGEVKAFIWPNDIRADASLKMFRATVKEIEKLSGLEFRAIPKKKKNSTYGSEWSLLENCNKS